MRFHRALPFLFTFAHIRTSHEPGFDGVRTRGLDDEDLYGRMLRRLVHVGNVVESRHLSLNHAPDRRDSLREFLERGQLFGQGFLLEC